MITLTNKIIIETTAHELDDSELDELVQRVELILNDALEGAKTITEHNISIDAALAGKFTVRVA